MALPPASAVTYGIIGLGNMGTAILVSALKVGLPRAWFRATVSRATRADTLAELYQIKISTDNAELVQNSDIILICVKPYQIEEICRQISPHLNSNKLVVSVAAGVPMEALERWLPEEQRLIRCMPNLPISIQRGVVGFYGTEGGLDTGNPTLEILFGKNKLIWLNDEANINVVTVMAGCMPGFISYLSKQFISAGVDLGMDEKMVLSLFLPTLEGTAILLSGVSPEELMSHVACNGGATQAGLAVMKAENCSGIIKDAIEETVKTIKMTEEKVMGLES